MARLVTGGVWIVAGGLKLSDPADSVLAVRAYQLLPSSVVPTVGQLLPVLEVVVGVALVVGLLTREVAVVSALLYVAFIVAIASVWIRGISIDCGCFGGGGFDPDADSAYPFEVARDVVLLGLSVFLVRLRATRLAVDSFLPRVPDPDPNRQEPDHVPAAP